MKLCLVEIVACEGKLNNSSEDGGSMFLQTLVGLPNYPHSVTGDHRRISKQNVGESTVEAGYNYVGLYETLLIESDALWYQLICYCQP
jgi:hypothetical protein